jgi:acyl dehydratase
MRPNFSHGVLAVRFSAPVYPGDTLHLRFWKCDDRSYRFRAFAAKPERMVLDNGVVEFRAQGVSS